MEDDDIIIKSEIRNFNFGNTRAEVIIPELTVVQLRKNLTNLYDIINDIARNCEKREIDTSNWFYTNEEIEKMKKDTKYTFI